MAYTVLSLTNTPTVCPRALKQIHEGDLALLPVEARYECVFFVRCFFFFSFSSFLLSHSLADCKIRSLPMGSL